MNKLFVACIALLATFAASVSTAAAEEGNPLWYVKGAPLTEGEELKVTTDGILALHEGPVAIKCQTDGAGVVVNYEDGAGEITALNFSACKIEPHKEANELGFGCPKGSKLEVHALGLPWGIELLPSSVLEYVTGAEHSPYLVIAATGPVGLSFSCGEGLQSTPVVGYLAPTVGIQGFEYGDGSGLYEEEEDGSPVSGPDRLVITGLEKIHGPAGDRHVTAFEKL